LAYTAIWTVSSGLSAARVVGAVLLWLLEAAAFLLALFYLWELIDALGSRRWSRRSPQGPDVYARRMGRSRSCRFTSRHTMSHRTW
jgi:hypothetical protein